AQVLGLDPLIEGPALRRQTGVLTETPSLDDRLTARETLLLYGQLYGVQDQDLRQRAEGLLETFDLGERADELVGAYSKGMRQRLALARTLIHQPTVLFLDEPTAGLDPIARRDVHDLIMQLSDQEGRTIFLCTHDLAEAQKLCDRVAVMENGRLVAIGTPDGLARELHKGVHLTIEVGEYPQLLDTAHSHDDGSPWGLNAGWQLTWDPATHCVGAWLPARESIPELIRTLVRTETPIYSVELQEATLEDVYFAINDRQRESGEGATR
ncbi:MAG: ABC transporter ATP-binding protein, partial [Anaerolineae bacterium]|nr:ABC transporter ATP-binding protein [Anaerolineae bacterium]